MLPQDRPTVKSWPELGRAALAQRRDREYRVWLLARAVGSGARAQFDDIAALGLRGLSPVTLRKILKDGDGDFWTWNENGIWWRSLSRLARALGVGRLSDPMEFEMPLKLQDFRAALTFAFDRDRPIAKETIGRGIDRTEQTVSNYRRAADVRVTANWRAGPRQIGNTYEPLYVRRVPTGRTRKANRKLRCVRDTEARNKERRARYLNSPKAVARRMAEAVEGDWFCERRGAGLWARHECWNGRWFTRGKDRFFAPLSGSLRVVAGWGYPGRPKESIMEGEIL